MNTPSFLPLIYYTLVKRQSNEIKVLQTLWLKCLVVTQRKESLIQAGLGMQIGQDGEKDRIILYPRISRMWKMETLHSMLRERDRNEEKPRWHQDKKAEQNGVPQSSCTDSSFQKHIQTSNSVIKIYSFLEIIKALVSSQLSVCLYSQFWSPPQRKQC